MIVRILKNFEFMVVKWYGILHIQQNRIIKLYNESGITQNIANRELRSIYRMMKFTKSLDNFVMFLLVKIQSLSIQR